MKVQGQPHLWPVQNPGFWFIPHLVLFLHRPNFIWKYTTKKSRLNDNKYLLIYGFIFYLWVDRGHWCEISAGIFDKRFLSVHSCSLTAADLGRGKLTSDAPIALSLSRPRVPKKIILFTQKSPLPKLEYKWRDRPTVAFIVNCFFWSVQCGESILFQREFRGRWSFNISSALRLMRDLVLE